MSPVNIRKERKYLLTLQRFITLIEQIFEAKYTLENIHAYDTRNEEAYVLNTENVLWHESISKKLASSSQFCSLINCFISVDGSVTRVEAKGLKLCEGTIMNSAAYAPLLRSCIFLSLKRA